MSNAFNWTCPFCNHAVVITDERSSADVHRFDSGNKYGLQAFHSRVYVCPNPECCEFTLVAYLCDTKPVLRGTNRTYQDSAPKEVWPLIPAASVRVFPDYVPKAILDDYREACLVRELSPKASASLARRCLQGMIRDYWGVSKPRLVDEIEDIKDRIDPLAWNAIDAVRNIGNIGAHMEKDINLIVDVEPEEATLLIGLIETLIAEWYVTRHERQLRMSKVISIAGEKRVARNPSGPSADNG